MISKQKSRRPWGPWTGTVLLILTALLIWQVLADHGVLNPIFFPSPKTVVLTLVDMLVNGNLGGHLVITLTRVLTGFAIGSAVALMIGLLMGIVPFAGHMLDPIIAALHPIPKISILPLAMIVFGIGENSKIALAALSVFFPVLINFVAGIRQINPLYLEVAENYQTPTLKIISRVIFPASLPSILVGARIGFNQSLVITIAIELITTQTGLGAMLWLAWETLRVETLYASLTMIAFLGVSANALLQVVYLWLVPWHQHGTT